MDGRRRPSALRHRPLLQLQGQPGRRRQSHRAGGAASSRRHHGAGRHHPRRALHRVAGDRRGHHGGRLADHAAPLDSAADDRRRAQHASVRAGLPVRLCIRVAGRALLRLVTDHGALCPRPHRAIDRHHGRADLLHRGDTCRRALRRLLASAPAQHPIAQARQREVVRLFGRVGRRGSGLLLLRARRGAGVAGDAAAATFAGVPDAVFVLA